MTYWTPKELACVSEGFCPQHEVQMSPDPPRKQGAHGAHDWMRHADHGYSLSLMLKANALVPA